MSEVGNVRRNGTEQFHAGRDVLCEFCGRSFHPCPRNAARQKYCTHADCVLERKRWRQRKWYADKRAADRDFRNRENRRCREANRLRRAACRCASSAFSSVSPDLLPSVVTGLIAQLTDTTDPVHLDASIRSYAARGQRLARSVAEAARPP